MRASTTANASAAVPGSWRETYRQRLFRHAPADRDPVTLRHRRIYILPTKRGIAFLATLAMALLTSLNYSLSLGFGTTFLLAGLVAASLIHTFRNLAGIELRPLAVYPHEADGVAALRTLDAVLTADGLLRLASLRPRASRP